MHFQLSCFLDHLRVQRQSSASVSELLITVSVVRERQQLRLLQSRLSLHCCDCQLSISSHHSLCLAVSRGSHALSQSTQYRSHQPWWILFTRCRSATQRLNVIVSAKTVSVHGLRDVLIIRHEPCGLARRYHVPRTVNRSHSKLALIASNTDRIEHSACHRSTSASTSTAPPTPPRDTQRERVHLSRFAILPDCVQTPSDVCPAPELLPTRLAWRFTVERERDKHMGLKKK